MSAKPAVLSSAAASQAAKQEPFVLLDSSALDREVVVLKVPDILADVVKHFGASGVRVGEFKTSASSISGAKRSRQAAQLVLDEAHLKEIYGEQQAKRIPQVYNVTLNPTDKPETRVLSQTEASGYGFFGKANQSGHLAPDMTHPTYVAFAQARRMKEKESLQNRKATELAPDSALESVTSAAGKPQTADDSLWPAAPVASRVSAAGLAGAVKSIFDLFERGPYWTIKELSEATGRKEADLRPEVQECCDYIRSGPHRGKHRLKVEYRTVRSAAPDANDGIEAS